MKPLNFIKVNKPTKGSYYLYHGKTLTDYRAFALLTMATTLLLVLFSMTVDQSTELITPESKLRPLVQQVQAKEITPTPKPVKILYSGKVSFYSHDGCLGCSKHQIMGNGKPFDENAMTLAIPCEDIISKKYRYNTSVIVVNNDNGNTQEAVITDCGGFSKYNRVADLSRGLYNKLEAKTDVTNIFILEK